MKNQKRILWSIIFKIDHRFSSCYKWTKTIFKEMIKKVSSIFSYKNIWEIIFALFGWASIGAVAIRGNRSKKKTRCQDFKSYGSEVNTFGFKFWKVNRLF